MIRVKAKATIVSDGGVRLAEVGDYGLALPKQHPSRPHHFGRVPIVWGSHRRAFWVDPDKVETARKSDVRRFANCIAPEREEEFMPEVPEGHRTFHFGVNLRLLRKVRELSQTELANQMECERVSQTTISNWERRPDCPAGPFLEAAARVLNVPAFVFFTTLDCESLQEAGRFLKKLQKEIC